MKKLILGLVMAFAITACSPQAEAPKSKCPCCEQTEASGKLSAGGKECCKGMKGCKMSTGTPCECCVKEGAMCKIEAKPAAKKAAPKPVAKAAETTKDAAKTDKATNEKAPAKK